MLELILSIGIVIITIQGQGILFNKIINNTKSNYKNFNETFLLGIIFLSFNVLFINFFIPINKLIGSIFLLISSGIFFSHFYLSNLKKKYLKIITILIIITFLLVAFSTVNRPDAGLYHLPYISIINENKIIFGIANLHSRFAHISIIQYTSSIFNNLALPKEIITIPLALIFSSAIIFIYQNLQDTLIKKKTDQSIILFFFIIFSIYSYNRYSAYGNDVPAHLFFQIFFIYIIFQEKNDVNFLGKIILIASFLFMIKPFMIILFPIIGFFFFKTEKKLYILLDRKIIFSLVFVFLWIVKNIIVSGCAIYPISKTCIGNIQYFDAKKTKIESISGEAWSKDWNNYKEKKYNIDEYNKKFRWLSTWSQTHFKIIIEKFGPFVLFLVIMNFVFFLCRDREQKKINNFLKINYSILIFFLFSLTFIWFIKFPIYRYGSSFLGVLFIFIFHFFIKKSSFLTKQKVIKDIISFVVILAIIGFSLKNSTRIVKNFNKNFWPQIYSLENNLLKKSQKFEKIILNDGGFYFFSNGKLCMYSNSPCTHIRLDNIVFSKILSYKVFHNN